MMVVQENRNEMARLEQQENAAQVAAGKVNKSTDIEGACMLSGLAGVD